MLFGNTVEDWTKSAVGWKIALYRTCYIIKVFQFGMI